jgi:O-antigen ligase/tetratricopeptide (TPR) repeat protein
MQWFIFIILGLILVVSPFSKGLYFDQDFFLYQIIIFVLFLAFLLLMIRKSKTLQFKSLWIIWLLPISTLIALLDAVSPVGSIQLVLRWAAYASFFMMLYWSFSLNTIIIRAPFIYLVAGILISFSMILSFKGIISYQDSLIAGRFAGVFQYPNTFGMIIGSFLLFSLIILSDENISYKKAFLYSFPLISFGANLIFSGSKGMFIIFPVIWVLGLSLLQVKQQLKYLFTSIVLLVFTVIGFFLLKLGVVSGIILFLLVSLLASGILQLLNHFKIEQKLVERVRLNKAIIPLIVFTVALMFVLDIKNEGLIYESMPSMWQSQISDISHETSTAKERIILAKDSLKSFFAAPLIGHGGNAWEVIYPKFQTVPYQTKSIHNGYLDWLVSSGIIGLLAFFAVGIYIFILIYRNLALTDQKIFYISIFMSLSVIFLHSFIDFNFSYGTVWLLIIWLISMGTVQNSISNFPRESKAIKLRTNFPVISLSLLSVFVVFCLLLTFRFMLANEYYEDSLASSSLENKERLMLKAVDLNPYETKYWFELGEISAYYVYKLKDSDRKNQVKKSVDEALQLEPHNPFVSYRSGLLLEKIGDYEWALQLFDNALNYDHFNTDLYTRAIQHKVEMGIGINDGKLIDSAIRDYKNNEKWFNQYKNSPEGSKAEFNSRDFSVSDKARYYAALAYYKKQNYTQCIYIIDRSKNEDAALMLNNLALKYVAYEKAGKSNIAAKILKSFEGDQQILVEQISQIKEEWKLR